MQDQTIPILDDKVRIKQERMQLVVKSNDLIQRSRFDLTLMQQKIVLYLISKIKPDDTALHEVDFSIVDFAKVCGIDYDSGGNYALIKSHLKSLRDKSIWIQLPDGRETTVSWIAKPYINRGNGTVRVRLDEDMMPYLLNLRDHYTRYELLYAVKFKSRYALRLYEFVQSVHFCDLNEYCHKFDLANLKKVMDAEGYTTWSNFNNRALSPAVAEINDISDKQVAYRPIRAGRAGIVAVELTISTKDARTRLRQHMDEEE